MRPPEQFACQWRKNVLIIEKLIKYCIFAVSLLNAGRPDVKSNDMTEKQKYMAPVLLCEIQIEMEGQILVESTPEIDPNFEKVETMGQEIGGTIGASDWSQTW